MVLYISFAAIGVIVGAFAMLVILSALRAYNSKHHKSKSGKRTMDKRKKEALLRSITNFLFVTTQVCALIWVFTSYGIAVYSMVVLRQVYTMSELSEPAITTLIATLSVKVLANMFEHNDGGIFGTSKKDTDATTDEPEPPGVG